MAEALRDDCAKPEVELFDSGGCALMADLIRDGSLDGPALCSFMMGVKYGFQPSPETVLYVRKLIPADAALTAIGIGRAAFPMAAQSPLAGSRVRVGLEDAVMIERGVLAPSNAAVCAKARRTVESLGARLACPSRARELLGLA